jgi:hypothetical protein
MSFFEWEFDDDRQTVRGPAPSLGWRRWLRRTGLLLILLIIVALAVRARLAAHQRAIAETEFQLRAAVSLELKTIADGDVELFLARQDPGDPIWRDRQFVRYLSPGAARFLPAPGLEPGDPPWEIHSVHLPDRSAQVARAELTRWLREPGNNYPAAPLPFRVTWFYRQADDGTWYHVAPPDDGQSAPYYKSAGTRTAANGSGEAVVIGFTLTTSDNFLRVPGLDDGSLTVVPAPRWFGPVLKISATHAHVPWRASVLTHSVSMPGEADLLDPIASDLGDLVARGCDWLSCPREAHYTLAFEDIPIAGVGEDVREPSQAYRRSGSANDPWVLPSPSLAGLPADEAARAAWEFALKLWLVQTLAESQSGDRSLPADAGPAAPVIYRQLETRLQAQLDLIPPATPDVQLLAQAVALGKQGTLAGLFEAPLDLDDPLQARLLRSEAVAFLDFLDDKVGPQRLFQLIPALRKPPEPVEGSRPGSVERMFALYNDLDRDQFTQGWYAYLFRLIGATLKSEDAQ